MSSEAFLKIMIKHGLKLFKRLNWWAYLGGGGGVLAKGRIIGGNFAFQNKSS